MTPRPLGDDSAASSTARDEPSAPGDGAAAVQVVAVDRAAGEARRLDPADRLAVVVGHQQPLLPRRPGPRSTDAPSRTECSSWGRSDGAARKPSPR